MLLDPWKKWLEKFVNSKILNNPMHKFTIVEFVSYIQQKAKESYMKRVAMAKLFTECNAGREGLGHLTMEHGCQDGRAWPLQARKQLSNMPATDALLLV